MASDLNEGGAVDERGAAVLPARSGIGFTPGGVSRWMRRRHRALAALMACSVVLGVAACFSLQRAFSAWSLGGVLVPVVAGGVCLALLARARGIERDGAIAACGCACPNCLYDLSAERVACCSECGQRVVYDALPVLWEKASWRKTPLLRVEPANGFGRGGHSRFELRWTAGVTAYAGMLPFALAVVSRGVVSISQGGAAAAGGTRIPASAMLVAGVVLLGPFAGVCLWLRRRLVGALRRSGGCCCPACLFDLSGGRVERCPECGQRVDYAGLRRMWRPKMKYFRLIGKEL